MIQEVNNSNLEMVVVTFVTLSSPLWSPFENVMVQGWAEVQNLSAVMAERVLTRNRNTNECERSCEVLTRDWNINGYERSCAVLARDMNTNERERPCAVPTNTTMRKRQLWQESNNIQQKDMSVSDYTDKIKSIWDSPGSININVEEGEMVQVWLGGLAQGTNPLRTTILARETPPLFFNLQSMLLVE